MPEQYSSWITQIIRIVDDTHYRVIESLNEIFNPPEKSRNEPPPQMPRIKLTPHQLGQVQQRLAYCDPHSRAIFCYLMERWQNSGYLIDTEHAGIGLYIPFGKDTLNLLRMIMDERVGGAIIWITWIDRLSQYKAIPPDEIARFQKTVSRLVTLKQSNGTTQIDINQAFTRETARKLIQALVRLAKSVQQDQAAVFKYTTPNNITEVLKSCPPHIRQLFTILIDGWQQAGGRLNCIQPNGRIYLKLPVGEHAHDASITQPTRVNLAALAGPQANKGARIEIAWNLAQGKRPSLPMLPQQVAQFEAAVARLPGFIQKGKLARLQVNDDFQPQHAEALLQALVDLKQAEEQARVKPA